jgi:uncharacterized protein with PIN domain
MGARSQITLNIIGQLLDFLPAARRSEQIEVIFQGRQSAKHLLEAAGVPHTEAGLLQVDGKRIDFSYLPQTGDRIKVFPASPELDEMSGLHRDGQLTIEPRFLLDNHLGRLAAWMRMLGFDSLYRTDYQDDDLAMIAATEERILITRDRRLLMRKSVNYGYCIRSLEPDSQISEVLARFALSEVVNPFHRCLRCNAPLEPVEKSIVLDQLEPLTRLYFHEFQRCPECGQIYWKGSHYDRMVARLQQLLPGFV